MKVKSHLYKDRSGYQVHHETNSWIQNTETSYGAQVSFSKSWLSSDSLKGEPGPLAPAPEEAPGDVEYEPLWVIPLVAEFENLGYGFSTCYEALKKYGFK